MALKGVVHCVGRNKNAFVMIFFLNEKYFVNEYNFNQHLTLLCLAIYIYIYIYVFKNMII